MMLDFGKCIATILAPVTSLTFVGAFAKSQKGTVSFAVSACRFVRMEQLGSHWTVSHEI